MRPYTLADLAVHGAATNSAGIAVRCGREELDFESFERRSAQLAASLIELGVKRGDRVGIYLRKSTESMIAVHGILRAAAAYVPLDTFTPPAVTRSIVDDCEIDVLVSHQQLASQLEVVGGDHSRLRAIVGADEMPDGVQGIGWADVLAGPELDAPPRVIGDDLAYVMYTSGSTGTPKGIMHTHRSGLRYAELAVDTYGLRPTDRLANIAPLHFDQSTFEMFAAPLAGASVLVVTEPYLKMPASLSQLIQDERPTVWYSVPFALIQLLVHGALDRRDLSSLRWVLFGGEVFPIAKLGELMHQLPNATFSNVYGPAEVNQCTFHHFYEPPTAEPLSIGRAWPDTEVIIVDGERNEVPPGVDGELLVRTSTMMHGYWRRADLDRAAFVDRGLPDGRTARYYATGDRAREQDDGSLAFLGRLDRQVKVRGHRVELAMVEAAIMQIHGVVGASVAASATGDTNELVAAVVLRDAACSTDAIKMRLAATLPAYAIPARVVELQTLPLTASGKVDHQEVQRSLS